MSGLLCGTTPHLTVFSVLLSGGGNTGRYTGDQCSNRYMTGSWGNDLAIVASIAGAVVLLCFLIALFGYSPRGRRLVAGPEGRRVLDVRHQLSVYGESAEYET